MPRFPSVLWWSAVLLLAFGTSMAGASDTAFRGGAADGERRPAVARANIRLVVGTDFAHVDRTRTSFFDSNTSTTSLLRFDATDAQDVRAELVGTLPVMHVLGMRARLRAAHGSLRRGQDGLDPGNDDFDTTSWGAGVELFARDPDRGALALGGSYDRVDERGGFEADDFGASAAAALFFPDMGSGPVDWTLRFAYTRRRISGAGSSFDVDLDTFEVRGAAGWYLTGDFQLELGGRWRRSDADVFVVEDRGGFLNLRWLLPAPVSIEVFAGGAAGVSEYKQPLFPSDDRLSYGARAGFVLRFRSAGNLIEAIRAHD